MVAHGTDGSSGFLHLQCSQCRFPLKTVCGSFFLLQDMCTHLLYRTFNMLALDCAKVKCFSDDFLKNWVVLTLNVSIIIWWVLPLHYTYIHMWNYEWGSDVWNTWLVFWEQWVYFWIKKLFSNLFNKYMHAKCPRRVKINVWCWLEFRNSYTFSSLSSMTHILYLLGISAVVIQKRSSQTTRLEKTWDIMNWVSGFVFRLNLYYAFIDFRECRTPRSVK